MSLKRKVVANEPPSASKKPKVDFFAPRAAGKVTPSTSTSNASFTFKPKSATCVRLTTWNINGIMSVDEKILKKYLEAEDPDILILTETKYSKGKPNIINLSKYQYWGVDPRAGHAGTAILSKFKPLKTIIGLPSWEESSGRYVELEFEEAFVVGTYAPNSGDKFKTMDLKEKWNTALNLHLQELNSAKPVIWGGDFNTIMEKKDLDDTARKFWNEMSGLSEQERAGFRKILQPDDSKNPAFVDAWRHSHTEADEYTFHAPKFGSWRLDSFITSSSLIDKVESCVIRNELKDLKQSDHWPVTMDIILDLCPKVDSGKEL
ncbi:DNase I-like protein [Agrocybe pediades]|nr:DNase I-like protein [Agrocybe pediades]